LAFSSWLTSSSTTVLLPLAEVCGASVNAATHPLATAAPISRAHITPRRARCMDGLLMWAF